MIPQPHSPATIEEFAESAGSDNSLSCAPAARLSEIRGGQGRTTLAALEILAAQTRGEPVAWIQPRASTSLYPPDLAAMGIDLDTLVVVNVPPKALEVLAASEVLLRSGGFGLVVADLTGSGSTIATRATSRLARLARQHSARLLLLTEEGVGEVGPLVSLRVRPALERQGDDFRLHVEIERDKTTEAGGSAAPGRVMVRGPVGASEADRVTTNRDRSSGTSVVSIRRRVA